VFEIRSESYREQPIFIRGPGAGRRVTAVRVLSDLLSLAEQRRIGRSAA
jgi:homoserine dehydrogenase